MRRCATRLQRGAGHGAGWTSSGDCRQQAAASAGRGTPRAAHALCEDPRAVVPGTPEMVTSDESGADVLNMRQGDGLVDHTEKRTHVVVDAHTSQQAAYVLTLERMDARAQSSQYWLL